MLRLVDGSGCCAQKLKLARYSNVEALVKAAEVPPSSPPAIEVRCSARSDCSACLRDVQAKLAP